MTVMVYQDKFSEEMGKTSAVHPEAFLRHAERRFTDLLPPEALEDPADDVSVVECVGKLRMPPLV